MVTPIKPEPPMDEARKAAADAAYDQIKRLPYEQTKEYHRAMEAQIQKQHRTGSTL